LPIYGLKCLDAEMCSCNGGLMKWKLNKWFTVKGKIELCDNGLHLTFQPEKWNGTRIFICETPKIYEISEDKSVCRKMRLLKELSKEELEAYEKVEQQALEAYKKVEQPAWEAYKKAKQPALEAYKKVEQPAWEAYKKVEQPALEAYQNELQSILKSFLEMEA